MADRSAESKEISPGLNLEQVAAKWEGVLESDPKDVEALVQLSLCYGRMRRSDDALTAARRAVALAPEVASGHRALGVELFLQDENEDAEEELRRAIELDPESSAARFPLAQLLADQGDWDGADAMLAAARDLVGEDRAGLAQGWYVEAYINLAGKELDAAEECIREALEYEDANPRIAALAYANLGNVQARRRQFADGIGNLETALGLNPYLRSASKLLGQLYLLRKRYSDALAPLLDASQDPRLASPVMEYSLGLAYAKTGDAERSRAHYQEALDSGLTGYYALAARMALIWSRSGVRWLVYLAGACLAVWLAVTRVPTPAIAVLIALVVGYAVYRWWAGRS